MFVSTPFFIRAARAGFRGVDRDFEDAARVDGAGERQVAWSITVPLAGDGARSGVVMTWARALGEFGATIMFAGNIAGRTQTLPLVVYGEFQVGRPRRLGRCGGDPRDRRVRGARRGPRARLGPRPRPARGLADRVRPRSGPVVDLGVDRRRQALAAHAGQQVRGGHLGHLAARRPRRRGDVRHDQAVRRGRRSGWSIGHRLRVGHVEARPRRSSPSRSASARAVWSTTGPRDVFTSTAVGFIQRQLLGVDQVPRLVGQVDVERHEVGPRRAAPRAAGTSRRSSASTAAVRALDVVVQDRHPEARAPAGPPPGRSARSRRCPIVAPWTSGPSSSSGPHVFQLPGADVAVALGQPPGGGHQQREGEVGGRVGQDARRVADRDAARACRPGRRCCRSRRRSCDDLQLRPGGVEELVVDPVGEERQDAVAAARRPSSSSSRGGGSSSGQTVGVASPRGSGRARRRGSAGRRRPSAGRSRATRSSADPAAPARPGSASTNARIRSSAFARFSREFAYEIRTWSRPDAARTPSRRGRRRRPPGAAGRRAPRPVRPVPEMSGKT